MLFKHKNQSGSRLRRRRKYAQNPRKQKKAVINLIKTTALLTIVMIFINSTLSYLQKPLSTLAVLSNYTLFVEIDNLTEYVDTFLSQETQENLTVYDEWFFDINENESESQNSLEALESDSEEENTDSSAVVNTVYEMIRADFTQPENSGEIVRTTLSGSSSSLYVELEAGFVKNQSELSSQQILDIAQTPLLLEVQAYSDDPQVLIYHTHATESFMTYFEDWYSIDDYTSRSTDNDYNMVAVGEVLTEQLNSLGVNTIQSTEQHDNPSYTEAYDNSRLTVQEYLELYPSIEVVIDLHRDAIQSDDTITAPATEIDGVNLAQLMIISCCDDGTNRIPNYQDNLSFATKLQAQLESDYPTITRPILLDDRFYNQDLSIGALLVEVGGHGNTLEEAKNSAVYLANSLAKVLLQ